MVLLILLAPALLAASIYMVLGRLVSAVGGEHHTLIPLKWVTKVFVFGDFISFSLQCAGKSMATPPTLMYGQGLG
jgi:hypothetical protein